MIGYPLISANSMRIINFNASVELHQNKNDKTRDSNDNQNNLDLNLENKKEDEEEETKDDGNYYNYINSGILQHNININDLLDELEIKCF